MCQTGFVHYQCNKDILESQSIHSVNNYCIPSLTMIIISKKVKETPLYPDCFYVHLCLSGQYRIQEVPACSIPNRAKWFSSESDHQGENGVYFQKGSDIS